MIFPIGAVCAHASLVLKPQEFEPTAALMKRHFGRGFDALQIREREQSSDTAVQFHEVSPGISGDKGPQDAHTEALESDPRAGENLPLVLRGSRRADRL